MKRYRQHWCWKFALGSWLVMGSAIGEAVLQTFAFSFNCAFAQITPDSTLPNNSRVRTQGNISTIEGGTQAGSNLFHSFGQFSVPTGGTAFFNNAADIQNIISRVTGGAVSNIDGLIYANGTANLFLINPSGIIFGQNAQLNIGGSFVASTANALQLGNIGFFSATDKNIPSPLLTINPSALLFNQINQNAAIQNNSIAFAGIDPAGFYAFGLRVPDGKSLLLVGGNVSIDAGELNANGGRVELGGLAEPGTVALSVDGDNLSLRFPENVARTSVSLTNQAAIYVEGTGGGDIVVNAKNLDILGGSFLSGGIGLGLGTPETIGGDITLNTTGEIKVAGTASSVSNLVRLESLGYGGNITINSGSLSLQDNALLQTSTYGKGNAGNITVRARDAVELGSGDIFSTVEAGGVGKGGNIDINAATLSLKDVAQLQTLTRGASATQPGGRGDAGNVSVNVTGAIDIAGEKNGFVTGISSSVQTGTQGNGGNITIDSGSFSLRDGAQLATLTSGLGNAGNVTVRARDTVSLLDASILSTVEASGVGKGGNIDINAATLSLKDGAQLATITRGASDSQPAGQGNAGNVNVNVTGAIDIAGEKNDFVSMISSFVSRGTIGNGGNITIDSGSFSLRDRAVLEASTLGLGNAGNVTVRTRDAVSLADASIFTTVESGGVGKGGNIDINAATLSLTDGAQLLTITRGASDTQPAGRGNAGNVNIKVTGAVDIAGGKNIFPSGIRSRVNTGTVGNGGNITINSGSFSLRDGAQLSAETSGLGNAGAIKVNAADFFTISGKSSNFNSGLFVFSESTTGTAGDILVTSPRVTLDNGARLNAQSASGNGGDINLQTDLLLLRRGAQISTTAGTEQAGGNGGNINIDAPSGFIIAVPSENSDITANAYTGSGGRVDIQAFGIYGIQPRSNPTSLSDITASSEFGVNGTVELNTPDIDPNSGLVNLPAIPVDTQVAQTCQAGGNLAKSSFTITGRGGLPPNPGEALSADAVQVDLVGSNSEVGKSSTPAVSTNPINPTPTRIVEANGWVTAANGDVILTNAPTLTPHSSWQRTADCRVVNQHQGN
ncbi:two-partner secretion domain-containing protein [Nostoc sp.]|uniref:two-partner secretion domain-containing protein n=1 Tax=Nostoc sp. TaxID=1180 RepID=UPI002FF53F7A